MKMKWEIFCGLALLVLCVPLLLGDGTPYIPATQTEVNAGTIHTKFVAPDTLAGWTGGGGGGLTVAQAIALVNTNVVAPTNLVLVSLGAGNDSLAARGTYRAWKNLTNAAPFIQNGDIVEILDGMHDVVTINPWHLTNVTLFGNYGGAIGSGVTNSDPGTNLTPLVQLTGNCTVQGLTIEDQLISNTAPPINITLDRPSSIFIADNYLFGSSDGITVTTQAGNRMYLTVQNNFIGSSWDHFKGPPTETGDATNSVYIVRANTFWYDGTNSTYNAANQPVTVTAARLIEKCRTDFTGNSIYFNNISSNSGVVGIVAQNGWVNLSGNTFYNETNPLAQGTISVSNLDVLSGVVKIYGRTMDTNLFLVSGGSLSFVADNADPSNTGTNAFAFLNAGTNVATYGKVPSAGLHIIQFQKGWTNDFGQRAAMVLFLNTSTLSTNCVTLTNSTSGECFTNAIYNTTGVSAGGNVVVFPFISPGDKGTLSNYVATGTISIVNSEWVLQ